MNEAMSDGLVGHPTVSRRLAEWVVGLRFEHLPDEVVNRAGLLVLDNLGVQLRGTQLPNVQPVRAVAATLGGRPEATTVLGGRVSAPQAAWVNGGRLPRSSFVAGERRRYRGQVPRQFRRDPV